MGRSARLKKKRQREALRARYERGEFEPTPAASSAGRILTLRLLTAWVAIMVPLVFVGRPGAQQAAGVAALIGGGAIALDLRKNGRWRLAIAIALLALVWFLMLQLVPPASLAGALLGP